MKSICYLSILSISCLCFQSAVATPHLNDEKHHHAEPGKSEVIKFIENKGQWEEEAKFKAEVPGGALFLTDKGFVYNYVSQKDLDRIHALTCGPDAKENYDPSEEVVNFHSYNVEFIQANPAPNYKTEGRATNYHNYFIGNDPDKWAGNVGLFSTIVQQNIYPGVDLKIYSGKESSVKYDFILAPGVNPNQIQLQYKGVSPQLQKDGHVLIQTTVNEVLESAPVSYQEINGERVLVKSKYVLNDNVLSFNFPDGYNPDYPLIIDPDLIFATYSGATSSSVYAYTTSYDDEGNLYAGGDAWSTGWPVTTGAYQGTYGGGGHEAAINKYNFDGTNLIFSTYFGGASWDLPHAMRVNPQGELVVVGSSQSNDLPVSTGAFQSASEGAWDMFVAHFTADGTNIVGATYLGGTGVDPQHFTFTNTAQNSTNTQGAIPPMDISFDQAGNIWVVGNSNSSDFPVTTNAEQGTLAGGMDGIISQLSPDCSQLLYSSYLGGAGNDGIASIIFDRDNNILVCGTTSSSDFPTTSGAINTTAPGGTFDGFLTKIDPATGVISSSTYLGTDNTDHALFIQNDCANNIYVLGRTIGNYPISPGVFTTFADGDVFVDKINTTLTTSLISTRLGNSQSNTRRFCPSSLLVDICGRIYIAGIFSQTGLPLTPDAYQTTPQSFYFATLEANFTNLEYATYFGQSTSDHNHIGNHRMDPQGFVYQSICNYDQYPTDPGVWSPGKQTSGQDILSFKFDFDASIVDLVGVTGFGGNDSVPHAVRGCRSAFFDFQRAGDLIEPLTLHFEISGTAENGEDYQNIADSLIFPANVDTASVEIKPLLISNPGNPNPRSVIISVLSPCGCEDGSDNIIAIDTILIYDSLYVNIPTQPETVCANDEVIITAEIDSTLHYSWEPAALIPDPIPFGLTIHPKPTQTTDYTITVTQPGAPSTCPPNSRTYRAVVEQYPQITMPSPDTTLCIMPGDSIDLVVLAAPAGVDYVYQWSPGDYLRDDFSGVNRFSAPTGEYLYHVNVSSPEAGCSAEDSMVIRVVPPFDIESVTPADTTIKLGDRIQLHAEGDAVGWLWIPVSYLDDPISPSPYSQPDENIVYQVIGVDQYGCRDTAMVKIDVEYETNNFIPSAFSPNGDGLNDFFNIANMRYERLLDFKVYNRYGQLVFESKDGKEGWDGTIDGTPAAMDTYFYLIRVVVPFENEPRTFKGDITLIR